MNGVNCIIFLLTIVHFYNTRFYTLNEGEKPIFHCSQVDVRESVAYKYELVCTINY